MPLWIIAGEKFREKWKLRVGKDCNVPLWMSLFKNYCYSRLFNHYIVFSSINHNINTFLYFSITSQFVVFFRSLLPHVNNIPANIKLRFRNRIQQVVDEFVYPPASPTFQPCPFSLSSSSPSASSTFNSLSSEGVASPPVMPENTYQNY